MAAVSCGGVMPGPTASARALAENFRYRPFGSVSFRISKICVFLARVPPTDI